MKNGKRNGFVVENGHQYRNTLDISILKWVSTNDSHSELKRKEFETQNLMKGKILIIFNLSGMSIGNRI